MSKKWLNTIAYYLLMWLIGMSIGLVFIGAYGIFKGLF